MFAIGDDSMDIVIWDGSRETKPDVRPCGTVFFPLISPQTNIPLMALVANFTVSPIVVAGFVDGAVNFVIIAKQLDKFS